MRTTWSIASLAATGSAAVISRGALQCHDISLSVSASAENKVLPNDLNLEGALGLQNVTDLETKTVGGDYTIGARYCEPTVDIPSRRETLQVLVPGATFTKDYWSGLSPPGTRDGQDQYSWVKHAAENGYHTLSIDRLCNGDSSHPGGLLECQVPLESETMHQIILAARSGSIPSVPKAFSKIIPACHSIGSIICNFHSATHPDDAEAYILTGFTKDFLNGLPALALQGLFLPASLSGNGEADLTYLRPVSSAGMQYEFYSDQSDPAVSAFNFDKRGTVTLGEVVTALLGQRPAPEYKGAVFVLNGNDDTIFCQSTLLNAFLRLKGDCEQGFSSDVRELYPGARVFGYHNTPGTGHIVNTHKTAGESFNAWSDFLEQAGF